MLDARPKDFLDFTFDGGICQAFCRCCGMRLDGPVRHCPCDRQPGRESMTLRGFAPARRGDEAPGQLPLPVMPGLVGHPGSWGFCCLERHGTTRRSSPTGSWGSACFSCSSHRRRVEAHALPSTFAREISRPPPRIPRLRPGPGPLFVHRGTTTLHSLRLRGRPSGLPGIFPIFSRTCRS